ncbi:PREDICTED: uncharacterized protein LOC108569782 [Nicrophorus vespilloides]|uniref:Uncharacterized protein LOC108569782 n=1 Tax=Nicrophorus vespilloides TaxID=110193 RepID=A0ABM1NJF4_NICVS|nr:PREDICTED: uncharacterized protein LOC108569782 [Nicrophorus vespilloides]
MESNYGSSSCSMFYNSLAQEVVRYSEDYVENGVEKILACLKYINIRCTGTKCPCRDPQMHRILLDRLISQFPGCLQDKDEAHIAFVAGKEGYKIISHFFKLPFRTLMIYERIKMYPGLNVNIVDTLKKYISRNVDVKDRLITLIFNEMSVVPHLKYVPRRGLLSGFEDKGYAKMYKKADCAQLFVVRSLYKNWKIPVSYVFSKGQTNSSTKVKYIKKIVRKLTEIGFVVAALICDDSGTNCAAIEMLLEDSTRQYIAENRKPKENIIRIDECEIVPIYDISHLIKTVRNHLLNQNLKFVFKGETLTANWEDIKTTYSIVLNSNLSSGFLEKFTTKHVYPEMMDVSTAVQVFNEKIGGYMNLLIDCKLSYPNGPQFTLESKGTVALFYNTGILYESLNIGLMKTGYMKSKRCIATHHLRLWHEAEEVVKTMRFVSGENEIRPPVLNNILTTIKGFINLQSILLKKRDIDYLPTKHFSQGSIEDSFPQLRLTQLAIAKK